VADSAGFFALSQSAPGTQQDFTFTPSTAAGTTATGVLTIDPLDFGADESGADLTSDFEFTIVGTPVYDLFTPWLPAWLTMAETGGRGARARAERAPCR
jgi:hypothetical protein